MSKRCPVCNTDNRDEARHCMACNQPFDDTTGAVRLCPSGRHPMDPGWEECPYCRVAPEGTGDAPSGRRATRVESSREDTVEESGPGPAHPDPEPPDRGRPRARQNTRFGGSQDSEDSPRRPDDRRIVALLVTYTWDRSGQVFPVREGRNYLGRDADCEICVPSDLDLSGRHATLIYRGKDFWIDDANSMNGTSVNGEVIEERQRLPDHASLQTGATSWTFVVVPTPS